MDGTIHEKPASSQQASLNFLDFVSGDDTPLKGSGRKSDTTPIGRPPQSYLENGVDSLTSLVITDDELRGEFNHYGSGFLTTTALFTNGKVGWVGTGLMYGLANAKPGTSKSDQIQDFALGAAKGTALKGIFAGLGSPGFSYAPTKGMLMGLASRGADDIFQRDLFTDPSKVGDRLSAQLNNKSALVFDAMVWTAGEGIFSGSNALSGGALGRNRYASAMFMGGTFGAINGGTAEITKQQATGDGVIDWKKVAGRGLLQGSVDAAAAGTGAGLSDPRLHANIKDLFSRHKQTLGAAVLTVNLTKSPEMASATDQARLKNDLQSQSEIIRPMQQENLRPAQQETLRPVQQEMLRPVQQEILRSVQAAQPAKPGEVGQIRMQSSDGTVISLNSKAAPLVSRFRASGFAETSIHGGETTISVMAPLLVGDPANPHGEASKEAWKEFDRQLVESKKLGIHAVSTDVWWGLVEPTEGKFSWDYYDKMSQHITKAGLKWSPILSFHQCGGNVGDNVFVPIPEWIWSKVGSKTGGDARPAQYVSEQGNASKEYVSAWATDLVLDSYGNVMREFQSHFKGTSKNIAEVNISLGPAGELRYPSYNSHDSNSGYPTRGALQAYSDMARQSFKDYAMQKYGGIEGLQKAWSIADLTPERINPPDNVNQFFERKDHTNTAYGRDFFDWYSDSLINHGKKVLGTAVSVFGAKDAPFMGIDIGAKVPGIHWYVGERQGKTVQLNARLAELTAGLIRTSQKDWYNDADGRGYRPILSLFREFQTLRPGVGTRVVPAMTALELADGQDGQRAQSLPQTLAVWVGQEAQRQKLELRGENALSFTLSDANSWNRMSRLLNLPDQPGYYSGLTLLRMGDVVNDPIARAKVSEIINAVHSIRPAAPIAAPTPPPTPPAEAKPAA